MRQNVIPLLLFAIALVASVVASVAARSPRRVPADAPAHRGDARDDSDGELYRLNLQDVIGAIHYDISLAPEFQGIDSDTEIKQFRGKVKISIEIKKEISEIKLHAAENIEKNGDIKVDKDGTSIEGVTQGNDPDHEFWTLAFNPPLTEGKYVINIEYTGNFPAEDDEAPMYGFYKSTYTAKDSANVESNRLLLATQFQPTHARKAFPCFDEPLYKATYDVTIEVPEEYGVLGNTHVDSNDVNDASVTGKGGTETIVNARGKSGRSFKLHKFTVNKKMSTYLLAFLIYEKDSYSGTKEVTLPEKTIPFRTFARSAELVGGPDGFGNAALSQENSPEILDELAKYTGVDYTLNKVDQAAIPDFAAGAMENWGLVTYRETALLFNPAENTEAAQRRVVEIIAHELAHQWFGNLVTTAWWSSTWLNEGFATYFEYYIVDEIKSEWRMMERLVVDEQQYAFATDALASAEPLTNPNVNSPSDVIGHFSTISYSKGGSILRMIINALGEDQFKAAINNYLEENMFSAVVPSDLFSALTIQWNSKPADVDPNVFFESWTTQPGYPLISVSREGAGIVKVSQKRFMLDNSESSEIYIVPLKIRGKEEQETSIWLTEKTQDISTAIAENSWILVENTGYFRVNYEEENWILLADDIETFVAVQRATLLDDALNLARGDQLSYGLAFKLVGRLKEEKDFIPWSAALSGLAYLYRLLSQVDEKNVFDKFVLDIVSTVYDDLGFDASGDPEAEKNVRAAHRTNILTWACRSGKEECIKGAVEKLTAHVDKDDKIDPDLRSVVYCYGVKHGEERLWNSLWNRLKSTQDAAERALLLPALGCIDSITTLHMYLEQSISGQYIRPQDASTVFSAVYTNPKGVDVALDFLVEESDAVFRSYGSMNALPNIIRGIAQYLHSDEQLEKLQKLESFNSNNPDTDQTVRKAVAGAIASVKANQDWVKEKKEEVLTAMENELGDNDGDGDGNGDGGAGATQPAVVLLAVATALAVLARS